MHWFMRCLYEPLEISQIYEIIVSGVSMNPIFLKYHSPLCRELYKLNKYMKGESWKWVDRLVTHDGVRAFAICLETDLPPWLP